MYNDILIPTDGSNEAWEGARHGVNLAVAVDATVHVLYVIDKGGNPWLSESMDEQLSRSKKYAQTITDEVAEMAEETGTECVTEIKVGPSIHEEINDYAEEADIDLIVVGSGYKGQIGGLLGSTAEAVVRTASVPVTTVRRGSTE